MCTISRNREAVEALKPVTCYKIVKAYKDDKYRYTPIQDSRIPLECFSEANKAPYVAVGEEEVMPTGKNYKVIFGKIYKSSIGRGFIHCFVNKADAVKATKALSCNKSNDVVVEVWKTEVPAGSLYFEGVNAWSGTGTTALDGMPTVAAKQIVFKKRVYKNKK